MNILKHTKNIRMDLEWIWASPRRRQAGMELPLASGQLTGQYKGNTAYMAFGNNVLFYSWPARGRKLDPVISEMKNIQK